MVDNFNENALIIRPTNMIPKGGWAVLQWFILGFSIVLIPAIVGLFLIWMPIFSLFIIPHKYKKNMPISCVLDDDKLHVYNLRTQKIAWSVRWSDISSIYYISYHWATPNHIGLRLNNYDELRASTQKTKRPGSMRAKLSKWYHSKPSMILSRMFAKCEVMIAYHALDRSPKDFASLLYLYMNMNEMRSPIGNAASSHTSENEESPQSPQVEAAV